MVDPSALSGTLVTQLLCSTEQDYQQACQAINATEIALQNAYQIKSACAAAAQNTGTGLGRSLYMLTDAIDIGGAIRRQAAALCIPDHLAQALHDLVMRFMFRLQALDQGGDRSTDAGWLVDRDLFGDRQVHRQVQERIGLAVLDRIIGRQRRFDILQFAGVFWMLLQPVGSDGFQRR